MVKRHASDSSAVALDKTIQQCCTHQAQRSLGPSKHVMHDSLPLRIVRVCRARRAPTARWGWPVAAI
eukprot:scaffold613285_cov32-Prasinocladus_malaysianus.AAC.1